MPHNYMAFPVYGQPFSFNVTAYLTTNMLPAVIPLLSDVLVTISQNGGAAAAPTGTFELGSAEGQIIIDLSAADMSAGSIDVYVACAVEYSFVPVLKIAPLQLGPQAGCSLDQASLLFEQMVRDVVEVAYTGGTYDGTTQQLFTRAGTGVKATRTNGGSPGAGGTGQATNLQ